MQISTPKITVVHRQIQRQPRKQKLGSESKAETSPSCSRNNPLNCPLYYLCNPRSFKMRHELKGKRFPAALKIVWTSDTLPERLHPSHPGQQSGRRSDSAPQHLPRFSFFFIYQRQELSGFIMTDTSINTAFLQFFSPTKY